MKEWVVVACRSEAKIFAKDNKNDEIRWVKTLVNKKGRRKEREFETDKPGMSYSKFSSSCAPHQLEGKHSHAEIVELHFAQTIAKLLKSAFEKKLYTKATIFAGPHFLGKIKEVVVDEVRNAEFVFINKNIEKENTLLIMKRLN